MVRVTAAERAIMQVLASSGYRLTATEIADKLGIGWATARKYGDRLYSKGLIGCQKKGNRIYYFWKF